MNIDEINDGFISRKEVLNTLINSHFPATGVKTGKTLIIEYTTKLRDRYVSAINKIPNSEVTIQTHGEWVEVGRTDKGTKIRKCSYCGVEKAGRPKTKFCPYCGCKMDLPIAYSTND